MHLARRKDDGSEEDEAEDSHQQHDEDRPKEEEVLQGEEEDGLQQHGDPYATHRDAFGQLESGHAEVQVAEPEEEDNLQGISDAATDESTSQASEQVGQLLAAFSRFAVSSTAITGRRFCLGEGEQNSQ